MSPELIRSHAIVDALEQATALPAVPARDWCDQCAHTMNNLLAPKSRRSVFAVAVGRGNDTIESLEAVGVHSGDKEAGNAVEQALLRGVPPAPRREGEIGLVSAAELNRSESCVRSPLIKAVASQGMIGLLLGIGLISGTEPGRVLWFFGAAEAASESLAVGDLTFVLAILLAVLRRSRLAMGGEPSQPIEWISERECETLGYIVQGMSVREIAEKTGRSAHTVHDHVKSLHRKLGANSRGELVARALGHLPPLRQEARTS